MAQEHLAVSVSANDNTTHDFLEPPKQTSAAPALQESPFRNQNATHDNNMPRWQTIEAKNRQPLSDGGLPSSSFPAQTLYTATSQAGNFPTTAQIPPSYSRLYGYASTNENPATEFPQYYDYTLQSTTNVYSMVDGLQATLTDISTQISYLQFQCFQMQQSLSHLGGPALWSYSPAATQPMAQNPFSSSVTEAQYNSPGLRSSNNDSIPSTRIHTWD